jgi:hypothetical protein
MRQAVGRAMMAGMRPESVVLEGSWLYAGSIGCRVLMVRRDG